MDYNPLLNLLESLRGHALLKGPIIESGEGHFKVSCLFAPWSHIKRQDLKPSMSISFTPDGKSWVKCFACQYGDTLENAIAKLDALTGYRIPKVTSAVIETETEHRPVIGLTAKTKKKITICDYSDELSCFPTMATDQPEAKAFLNSKGVPDDFARKMNLRWVSSFEIMKKDNTSYTVRDAVLFPVYSNICGKLVCVGAQARPLHRSPTQSKYITLLEFPSSAYYYGEHLLPKMERQTVFVVEGVLDTLHLLSLGFWSLGLLGLYLSEERAVKLRDARTWKNYLMTDPDPEGQKAVPRIVKNAEKYGLTLTPLIPTRDPKQLTEEDLIPLL